MLFLLVMKCHPLTGTKQESIIHSQEWNLLTSHTHKYINTLVMNEGHFDRNNTCLCLADTQVRYYFCLFECTMCICVWMCMNVSSCVYWWIHARHGNIRPGWGSERKNCSTVGPFYTSDLLTCTVTHIFLTECTRKNGSHVECLRCIICYEEKNVQREEQVFTSEKSLHDDCWRRNPLPSLSKLTKPLLLLFSLSFMCCNVAANAPKQMLQLAKWKKCYYTYFTYSIV